MHEKMICLIHWFFQGLMDKKMKKRYGDDWIAMELVPYAAEMQDAENAIVFVDFLGKGEKRGYALPEDIDIPFAWYLISVDSKFCSLFQLKPAFYELVKRIKDCVDVLKNIYQFEENDRNIVYKRVFLNIKEAYINFHEQWSASEKFAVLYFHVEDTLFSGLWYSGNGKEDDTQRLNDEDAYRNMLLLFEIGETYFANKKLESLSKHGYIPAIMKSKTVIKNEDDLEKSISYLKNMNSENPQIKELIFSYENMKDLMEGSKQGYPESSYYLGLEYERPDILKKDDNKAMEYFLIACKADYKPAKEKILQYALAGNDQAIECIMEDCTSRKGVFKEEVQKWKNMTLNQHEAVYYPIVKRMAESWTNEELYQLAQTCRILAATDERYDSEETSWLERAISRGSKKAKFALGYNYAMQYFMDPSLKECYIKAEANMAEVYHEDKKIELAQGSAYGILSLFYLGQFVQGEDIDYSKTRLERVVEVLSQAMVQNISGAYIWMASLYTLKGIFHNMSEKDKKDKIIATLLEGAKKGNADVQCELGYFYLYGKLKDGFYIKSDMLQNQVGNQYALLNETVLDAKKAVTSEDAQKNIDYKQALFWFEQAAKQNDGFAMLETGKCYLGMLDEYSIIRIPTDCAVGLQWLDKAASISGGKYAKEAKLTLAMYHLGYLFFGTWKNCVKHSFSRDADKGFALLTAACKSDPGLDRKYFILLGLCYAQGNGVKQDHDKALQTFLNIREKHNTVEYDILLGRQYYAVERYEDALKYLAGGCSLGIADALYYAGMCYMKPYFNKSDFDRGYEMVISAAEKDYIPALNKMAEIYGVNGITKNKWEKRLKNLSRKEVKTGKVDKNNLSGLLTNLF
jgi:TPR repeat protein